MKRTNDPITLANLELDKRLFENLRSLQIIRNQAELGQLCGKNPSYYGCMRHKGFGLKIGSLTFLAVRLARQANDETESKRRVRLKLALKAIRETIDDKCRLRELELHGD